LELGAASSLDGRVSLARSGPLIRLLAGRQSGGRAARALTALRPLAFGGCRPFLRKQNNERPPEPSSLEVQLAERPAMEK